MYEESVITPKFFGDEFARKCEVALEYRKRFRSKDVEIFEEFDLRDLVQISKRELMKGRFVVKVDKFAIASADDENAWAIYKRNKQKSLAERHRNKRLKEDPLIFVKEALSINNQVSKIEIRNKLDEFSNYTPESFTKVVNYLEGEGIEIN